VRLGQAGICGINGTNLYFVDGSSTGVARIYWTNENIAGKRLTSGYGHDNGSTVR